ncbi:MAG: signal peptide peptidase SppA [Bacteroidales bacterium]|nr:signal peptide peptidase SppA [Bacteroidales bacterium]
MKDFFKMVLAVICGMIILGVLSFILSMGFFSAALAAGSGTPSLPKSGGVLKIDMSKVVFGEQTLEDNPLGSMDANSLLSGTGTDATTIGIWDAVQAIHAAEEDPAVKFIYIKTDGNATGVTALGEVREALKRFRAASGKPVVAYMENPGTGSYYFASVADKIYMTSYIGANSTFNGVSSQMVFLGDLLKRFGVNMQLIRHGKYKSAGEMYTRNSASPENREQYQRMVASLWESIGAQIAEARGISVGELDAIIEGLRLNFPQDFIDNKLADELLSRQGLEDKLASLAVVDKYKDIKWINFADYVKVQDVPSKIKQKIAVIYADGEIIDGSGKTQIAGDRFASVINKVRNDSTVKAVVLRVNSPGGSVFASEKIKTELDLLKEEKPLVASYGDYAASGGYWISNNAEKIFTDATTLTGSIGVFGLVPDFSKTIHDIAHVGVEAISSHKHGDMYGLMRPFDTEEYNYMLASIENVYDRFTTIVSEGRGIPKETVDAIGQGRVWTGADALQINLVDEIGTLEDAVRYAAVVAGEADLDKWNVKGYPAPPTMMEQVFDMLGKNTGDQNALVVAFKRFTQPQVLARMDNDIRFQ